MSEDFEDTGRQMGGTGVSGARFGTLDARVAAVEVTSKTVGPLAFSVFREKPTAPFPPIESGHSVCNENETPATARPGSTTRCRLGGVTLRPPAAAPMAPAAVPSPVRPDTATMSLRGIVGIDMPLGPPRRGLAGRPSSPVGHSDGAASLLRDPAGRYGSGQPTTRPKGVPRATGKGLFRPDVGAARQDPRGRRLPRRRKPGAQCIPSFCSPRSRARARRQQDTAEGPYIRR